MKLDRLLAITMLLLNRRRVSAKELSERFEVSLRTVYRDLETINQAGIPVVSYAGASGGYEIMDQYRLDRQFLTMEELQSIIIALRGIRSSLEEQDVAVLLDKVGALVARSEHSDVNRMSEQLIIDINPWHGGQADKELLGIVREAIRTNRVVQFAYTSRHGEDSLRECEPMGVVLKGYAWYLYGYCLLRGDYRTFRLSRIERLQVLERSFERRAGVPQPLSYCQIGEAMQSEHPLVTLVLRFQPRVKARVMDYFEPGQIQAEPEGTLLVTTTQPDEPWLYSMLLGYATDVTVVEPKEVAHALAAKAREIVRMYERTLP
ncbi:putative DNA-binding transcriptional regulator YafY [Paenibacillus phyllosphaerae]|uniref:Putative DNA-binding transcriptional regulator YafY n=1 Tax=Paenibacillus phyllosphaerae TaxID=274593 RepID=A0A7W5FN25_9BACL|nr:putative DNA-binding transcriptional regulator YafY [Paenibacillus phyllosphaerae]